MTKEEVLKECKVVGNVVKLPDFMLDRKLYLDVKKVFETIGGKWTGGKTCGFVFQKDPTDLLSSAINGNVTNLKKDFQMFFTPPDLCKRLVDLAEIKRTDRILEPSAGHGAIIEEINKQFPALEYFVDYCEILEMNRNEIEKSQVKAVCVGHDFLKFNAPIYDKIIANPPFANNQDIDHIYQMVDCLNITGRLVSITSTHWTFASGKKETIFRSFLDACGAKVYDIPYGSFKVSGTMTGGKIVVIQKDKTWE